MNRSATTYSGTGYWAVQIGLSALLALLGLGGGVFILMDVSRPDYTGSASVGDGVMALLTGVVFLVLLLWLIASMRSGTREQRAIYAWAIMQDYVARHPGERPLRPGRTVRGDVASLGTAAMARDGQLSYEEVMRLQALRPEVPYLGDLEALRRASAERSERSSSPEQDERQRALAAADATEAAAAIREAGLDSSSLEPAVRRTATVAGWAAIACFLLSVWTKQPVFDTGTLMALIGLWCVLRLVSGILQDVRIRRGRALAETWRTDPAHAGRNLPSPLAEYVRTPLGAWWMRLLTPATVIGLFFFVGGAANIGAAAAADERTFFIGFTAVSFVLLLASIVLRMFAVRRMPARERPRQRPAA